MDKDNLTNRLPLEFTQRMEGLLKDEWDQLLTSWLSNPHQGLRINTLKIPVEMFVKKSPFQLESIPWTRDGFYYPWGERPAKHPYYWAGLYYLQEPSAMAPGAVLDVKPGERVLDMCAAPGGKSTQLAAFLENKGILVSNDISGTRIKALAWNMERFGVTNAVITNESPENLAAVFTGYFDKILIDAPCSGEGMFRKDPKAIKSWKSYNTNKCVSMQDDILDWGVKMLRPGGKLVYSTCTFAPEENEGTIWRILTKYKEVLLLDLPEEAGWAPGRPEWLEGPNSPPLDLAKTKRLWPHRVKGEGHFVALLQKEGEGVRGNPLRKSLPEPEPCIPWQSFEEENFKEKLAGSIVVWGKNIYRIPQGLPSLHGLKVVRPGWFLGVLKNTRFQPAQALALGIKRETVQRSIDFSVNDQSLERYLRGETLILEGERGWTLICVDGYPLGWGKQGDGILKNYYPPHWRSME